MVCVSDSQDDRAPDLTNCLCVIDLIINLLFIAAEMDTVVWEHFLLQDCMIEDRFVGGEKTRECEVDGRCQRELYSVRYPVGLIEMSANPILEIGGWLTPSRYARSKRRAPTPTCIFVFMLLTSPGNVRGTETIMAAAARQFYERREGQDR